MTLLLPSAQGFPGPHHTGPYPIRKHVETASPNQHGASQVAHAGFKPRSKPPSPRGILSEAKTDGGFQVRVQRVMPSKRTTRMHRGCIPSFPAASALSRGERLHRAGRETRRGGRFQAIALDAMPFPWGGTPRPRRRSRCIPCKLDIHRSSAA